MIDFTITVTNYKVQSLITELLITTFQFWITELQLTLMALWLCRHEVPTGQIEALRSQLLQLVVSYASGVRVVLTRLCVAVSRLLSVCDGGQCS